MTVIDLADRRNPGIDLEFFEMVADELKFGDEIMADFSPRLRLLDAQMRTGCVYSKRYWRLLRVALADAIPFRDTDRAIDSVITIAALLTHWHGRHCLEEKERCA